MVGNTFPAAWGALPPPPWPPVYAPSMPHRVAATRASEQQAEGLALCSPLLAFRVLRDEAHDFGKAVVAEVHITDPGQGACRAGKVAIHVAGRGRLG